LCLEILQAAGFSLMPSMKTVPLTTSASSGLPFNDRQPFDAVSISLNTIVRHAERLPLPFVLSCLNRVGRADVNPVLRREVIERVLARLLRKYTLRRPSFLAP
jgi:hypothetical protein